MHLKSIKLAGFKSFVDPTTVNFSSNMCSIVGPNGCGKSNIIDAVRWVMGESSAKNLRGEMMSDVIFKGTTHRQSVSQASIELIFDNTNGKILGEYAAYNEISVRRVVTREATSEYWLNGSKCRRRDVTDLFLGTGLGPRSYAIIEQGMISRLIESRPEELRIFIEEAAGISKYKERRREAENRMKRTTENLERLTDLREELGRNLQHLQYQAQTAEKYTGFKTQERKIKAQLLALQWREFCNDSHQSKIKLEKFEISEESERVKLSRIGALIETLRIELSDATDQFNEVQANFYTVGGEVTRVEQALRFQQEKRIGIQQDLEQTQIAFNEAHGHLQTDRDRLSVWHEELSSIEPELLIQRKMASAAALALTEAEQSMTHWQGQWDEFNQRAAGPKQTSEVQQSRIGYMEQVLQRLQERISRLESERASLTANADTVPLEKLEEKIDEINEVVTKREATIEHLNEQITLQCEHVDALRHAQDEKRSTLQQLRGQQASLHALQRAAMNDSETELLHGWLESKSALNFYSLFESLSVSDGWASAVEQVLGDALTAVCIDNLQQLFGSEFESVPAGALLVSSQGKTISADIDTLAAQVSGPVALMQWLDKVYTASDLASAIVKLAQIPVGSSVITPDGQWFGHNWVRIRSEAKGTASVIERRELLVQIEQQIETLQIELQSVDNDLNSASIERTEQEQLLNDALRQLKDTVRNQANLMAERTTNLSSMEQLEIRRTQLQDDLEDAQTQFDTEQTGLIEARAALLAALNQMKADSAERENLLIERDRLREALQQSRDNRRDTQNQVYRNDMRAQNLQTQIETMTDTIQRLEQQVEQLELRSRELRLQLPEVEDPDIELKEQLESLLAQRIAAESALTETRQQVSDKEYALHQEEKAKMAVEEKLQAIHREIEPERLKQAGQQVHIETLEGQLCDLETNPQTMLKSLPESATEPEWQVKLEQIANKITRLGSINLTAIDECARLLERKNYLDTQNEDLESALSTLENAIRKIDKETRSRFRETLEQVNIGFSEVFPRVFGGGAARLEMTGDDLLDTGVAIVARPPGKKNSTIHLLSGGEKAMTAIALVFSIFRLNPAPFCMLDEVDAPLDDANVSRYVHMLKEMSEKVQFIFITHNKITMEAANHLMGVTMHEPGISRLVTVDIEEAAQLAAN